MVLVEYALVNLRKSLVGYVVHLRDGDGHPGGICTGCGSGGDLGDGSGGDLSLGEVMGEVMGEERRNS